MKQFVFILGKNSLLSLCEISYLLQYPPHKGSVIDYSKQVGIIEFEELQHQDSIIKLQNRLGGVQKICEVIAKYPRKIFIEGFPLQKDSKTFKKAREFFKNELSSKILIQFFLNVQNKKFMFAVSIYPHLFSNPEFSIGHLIQFLNKFIKDYLEKKGNKVKYFKYPQKLIMSKNLNPIWPHHVLIYSLLEFPNAEIVFGFTKDHCYIAKTIAVDNPNINKFIDEVRPKSQFEISIPPKLAKILLNLLNLPKNGVFLDPFCGTGTILMVAALQGINFYGTDISHECIETSKKNLKWLMKELHLDIKNLAQKIFILDAKKLDSKFDINSIDGIATEPYLGPILKTSLTKSDYEEIIENKILPLYSKSLQSMKKILKNNGKIAITSPVYKDKNDKIVDFDLSSIAIDLGLKIIKLMPSSRFNVKNGIKLNRTFLLIGKDQKILRKLNLFQKLE